MTLLTLNVGVTNMVVAVGASGHAEPRTVGARVYAFAGNERSWIRAEPMVVQCELANVSATTVASYRALFANAAQVPCSGDVFNNGSATVICSGEITDEIEQGGSYWVTTLTLYATGSAGGTRTQVAVGPSGVGDAVLSLRAKRRVTVAAAGSGLASVTLNGPRRGTAAAAGRGTPVVTVTKLP